LTDEGLLKICALREQMNMRQGKIAMRKTAEIKHFLAHPKLRFIHNEKLKKKQRLPGTHLRIHSKPKMKESLLPAALKPNEAG